MFAILQGSVVDRLVVSTSINHTQLLKTACDIICPVRQMSFSKSGFSSSM
jgi:hypothetical protein